MRYQSFQMRQRKIITFILPSFAGGGAERVAINLLNSIDCKNFEPHLVVLSSQGPLAKLVKEDIPIKVIGHNRLRDALPNLIFYLRKSKPDIIFSTFTHISLVLLLVKPLLKKTKFIIREASLPSANIARMPFSSAMKFLFGKIYPNADKILASSVRMFEELTIYGIPKNHIQILPNPIDTAALQKNSVPISSSTKGAGRCFIAAGRLRPEKNFPFLLDAMSKISPEDHCIILGEGDQRNLLEERISQLNLQDRVTLMGFVDNPAPWVANADAFLMPSLFEGMPNAALEALALGTPVIASPAAGGIRELPSVTIAEPGPDFLRAMQNVPIKQRHNGGNLAPSLLPDEYDIESVGRQFNKLLSEVCLLSKKDVS